MQLLEKTSQNPRLTAKDLQEDGVPWSCAALLNCSVTPVQMWPSWKSHQKKPSPASSPLNLASEVGKRTSGQVRCTLETG